MNISSIKKYNQLVCELVDILIATTGKESVTKNTKIPFFLLESDIEKLSFFETPVSISQFCNYLNSFVMPGMKKLRATDLTKGLVKLEYLEVVDIDDEKSYKRPTNKGIELGIVAEERENALNNKYVVNLYDEGAQKYIVHNMTKIIKKGKE